jgi:hypothetical protein
MVRAGRHPKSDERTLPTPNPLAPSSILQLGLADRRKKQSARLACLHPFLAQFKQLQNIMRQMGDRRFPGT